MELFIRCNICNKTLSEPVFNRDLQTWEPCDECLEVIRDTLSAFYDRPSAAEDELVDGDEISLDNLPEI